MAVWHAVVAIICRCGQSGFCRFGCCWFGHVGDVDHVELEDGHHFAFIAPFADRVTREETIPVALDPAGFDRAAWLDDVNQQIVAFMLR